MGTIRTKMTYEELNDLTHAVSNRIDIAVRADLDRSEINDLLSTFLQGLGIEFVEGDE